MSIAASTVRVHLSLKVTISHKCNSRRTVACSWGLFLGLVHGAYYWRSTLHFATYQAKESTAHNSCAKSYSNSRTAASNPMA